MGRDPGAPWRWRRVTDHPAVLIATQLGSGWTPTRAWSWRGECCARCSSPFAKGDVSPHQRSIVLAEATGAPADDSRLGPRAARARPGGRHPGADRVPAAACPQAHAATRRQTRAEGALRLLADRPRSRPPRYRHRERDAAADASLRFSGRPASPAPTRSSGTLATPSWSARGSGRGNAGTCFPAFFEYGYPRPEGVELAGAPAGRRGWVEEATLFVLPYEAVRSAPDPFGAVLDF
jgi:hypothetical protein